MHGVGICLIIILFWYIHRQMIRKKLHSYTKILTPPYLKSGPNILLYELFNSLHFRQQLHAHYSLMRFQSSVLSCNNNNKFRYDEKFDEEEKEKKALPHNFLFEHYLCFDQAKVKQEPCALLPPQRITVHSNNSSPVI